VSYLDLPPDASMLYALEVPPEGGDTWICGMESACASLPEHLKDKVRGRRIKHDGTYRRDPFDASARRVMDRTQIKRHRPQAYFG
jgi:alpha-ketoglutarate-dependent taurine dioxygenase